MEEKLEKFKTIQNIVIDKLEGGYYHPNMKLRNPKKFATDFGVSIEDTSLAGLTSRAVIVLDENNVVLHSELVSEITEEPNYEAALNVL